MQSTSLNAHRAKFQEQRVEIVAAQPDAVVEKAVKSFAGVRKRPKAAVQRLACLGLARQARNPCPRQHSSPLAIASIPLGAQHKATTCSTEYLSSELYSLSAPTTLVARPGHHSAVALAFASDSAAACQALSFRSHASRLCLRPSLQP